MRKKIVGTVLLIMLAVLVAQTALTGFQSIAMMVEHLQLSDQQRTNIKEHSVRILDDLTTDALLDNTVNAAKHTDGVFYDIGCGIREIRDCAEALLRRRAGGEDMDAVLPKVQSNDGYEIRILFDKGVDPTSEESLHDQEYLNALATVMRYVYTNFEDVGSCVAVTENGVGIFVNDFKSGDGRESGAVLDISMRDRFWYREAVESGDMCFSNLKEDYFTGRDSVMCSVPYYDEGKLAGVIGIDMFPSEIKEMMPKSEEELYNASLIDASGKVVYSRVVSGPFRVTDDIPDLRYYGDPNVRRIVCNALDGKSGVEQIEIGVNEYYVAYAPIPIPGWARITVLEKWLVEEPIDEMLAHYDRIEDESSNDSVSYVKRAMKYAALLMVVMAVVGGLIMFFVVGHMLKPMRAMTKEISEISSDELDFQVVQEYRTNDEVQVLAESFAGLTARMRQYIEELTRITAEQERLDAELALGRTLQANMLPQVAEEFRDRSDFEIAALMTPAKEVGGDFYDAFLIDEDHLALVMADVSGKGVPSAMFMVVVRTTLKAHALLKGGSPAVILEDVNKAICANNKDNMFVTIWLGIVNLKTGRLRAASAGHAKPIVRQPGEPFALKKDVHGCIVGASEKATYKEYELALEKGAALLLYTDGLTEAVNETDEMFGPERALESLNRDTERPLQSMLEDLKTDVDRFAGEVDQFDDLTMLAFRYLEEPLRQKESI